jgi:hypothetical protein
MNITKKVTQRVTKLTCHLEAFYEEIQRQANCDVAVPDRTEVFQQWMLLRLATLEISMENICEAINRNVEQQHAALQDIQKLKMN